MKEVTLNDMKTITIDGLKYLKAICDNNNITYFLAYGTLLGAVRHKGYIPWDDDIDIWVYRKDYYKLIKILFEQNNSDWEIVSNQTHKGYLFEWAKLSHKKTMITPSRFVSGLIYGVSIDIFPIDKASIFETENQIKTTILKYKKQFIRITSKYRGFTNACKTKCSIYKHQAFFKISTILLGPYSRWIRHYDAKLIALDNGKSIFLFDIQLPTVIFPSEWFNETIDLEFENEFYKAPKEFDKVLTATYGDYMKLPPEEKRVTHHFYKAYYK